MTVKLNHQDTKHGNYDEAISEQVHLPNFWNKDPTFAHSKQCFSTLDKVFRDGYFLWNQITKDFRVI